VIRTDPVKPGLLYVGTETGVFFSIDDGATWTRLEGGFPVVPVYDLKLKNSDLVAATHGRSFWILDDVTPLRELAANPKKAQLVTPRETVRNRLAWSAGMSFTKTGISYSPAFGIGASTEGFERVDGSRGRHYLDVGENPPNGAIVYYWLPKDSDKPVVLSFQEPGGRTIVSYRSDDKDAPHHKRPGTKAGLNRFVWDLKHGGPTKLDPSLVVRKYKPFADEGGDPSGPVVKPGSYRVTLEIDGQSQAADFAVVKDPRVKTSRKAFDEQFALLQELYGNLGSLNGAVNRIRLLKRQLNDLPKRLGEQDKELKEKATGLIGKLEAIEGVLVDIKRETPRDVLRNPAGLNDTLNDVISVVAIADAAPTAQARQVAQEVMGTVNGEIKKLDKLIAGDVQACSTALRGAGLDVLGVPRS
jgi:hypothetical protein